MLVFYSCGFVFLGSLGSGVVKLINFFFSDDVGSWFYHCEVCSFRQKEYSCHHLLVFGVCWVGERRVELTVSSGGHGISSLIVRLLSLIDLFVFIYFTFSF